MLVLIVYRIAWSLVLPLLHTMAAAERIVFKVSGKSLWPAQWRLSERLSATRISDDSTGPVKDAYWLHAASLGECKGLWSFTQTLCDELASKHSNKTILLTTNTVTGLDFLRREFLRLPETARARYVARLAPLDHPHLAQQFIRTNRVRALVLFEVELWPHWIAAARRANIPTLWISARLTQRARVRYAGNPLFAGALQRVLRNIDWIQAQTEDEEHALRRLGASDITTGCDMRGLHYLATHTHTNENGTAPSSRRGLAFVSLHARELPVLIPKLPVDEPSTPLIFFPRKLEELKTFVRLLAPLGFTLHSQNPKATRLIVDSFGQVGETLTRMQTAVIGGSFGSDASIGGHNVWEPLVAGCAIVIGPHHANQQYLVNRLHRIGLLRVVSNEARDLIRLNEDDSTKETTDVRDDFIRHELLEQKLKQQDVTRELAKRITARAD